MREWSFSYVVDLADTVVAAVAEQARQKGSGLGNYQPIRMRYDPLPEMRAAHERRMRKMRRQTVWGARIGTAALLALVLVSAYGLMQLIGVAP